MSVSVSTFSTTIEEFLQELKKVFPKNKTISVYKSTLRIVNATAPGSVVRSYMNLMSPYEDLLRNEDNALMKKLSEMPGMFQTMGLADLWGGLDKRPNDREAIWKYLKTLYVIGLELEPLTKSEPDLEAILPSPEESEESEEDEDPMATIAKLFPPGVMEQMMANAEKEFGDGKGGVDQKKVKKLIEKMAGSGGPMANLIGESSESRRRPKNKNIRRK